MTGAIELSTHGDDYPIVNDDFPKKVIKPKEGDVIFFPSSVFHRTIPFESDEERICIAFDLKTLTRSFCNFSAILNINISAIFGSSANHSSLTLVSFILINLAQSEQTWLLTLERAVFL